MSGATPGEAAADGSTLLEVRELSAGYGGLHVLSHASLDAGEGEWVALFGPNGGGKTTLLEAVAGLAETFAGTVRLAGQDLSRLGADARARAGMAYVPAGGLVFPSLTIREHLDLAAGRHRLWRRGRRIREAQERFPEIARRRGRRAATLGAGDRQLLALAAAVVAAPKLLLVDDPLAGVDPEAAERILDALADLSADGVAILMAADGPAAALARADTGHYLESGRIRRSGTADALLSPPEPVGTSLAEADADEA